MRPLTNDAWNRLQFAIFGGLQSTCILIIILSIYVTGYFLGGTGEYWLWIIGGAAVGVKSVAIVYRWQLLQRM